LQTSLLSAFAAALNSAIARFCHSGSHRLNAEGGFVAATRFLRPAASATSSEDRLATLDPTIPLRFMVPPLTMPRVARVSGGVAVAALLQSPQHPSLWQACCANCCLLFISAVFRLEKFP